MEPDKKGNYRYPSLRLLARISARQRIIASAVLIVVCTIIAFFAKPPDFDKPAGSIVAWFFRPLDPFALARKPFINSDLRAITRVPDKETLIAVGSGGLIIRSEDLGRHWEPRIISLTPEEINRLQRESGQKEKDWKSRKRPSSKTEQGKRQEIQDDKQRQNDVSSSVDELNTEQSKIDQKYPTTQDHLPSLRDRKMSEQVAPAQSEVLPETVPENEEMAK